MRLTALATLALAITMVTANPIDKKETLIQAFGKPTFVAAEVREDTYSQTLPAAHAIDARVAIQAGRDDKNPYVWDFETYSQANYYGDRQRFNGDGCVNFRCSEVLSYKGLPNKEYIFYDGDDCYGGVLLRTTEEKMVSIKQPFHPCSIRVQWPSNWKGAGKPPAGSDLALFPQPSYKGRASTFQGKKCHNLKGDGVMSFQGHENLTYTFYRDENCSGKVLEKRKGPESRTDTYMTPMSVKIE